MQAYGLHTFQSLASNTRSTVANRHTALRKCEQLLKNEALIEQRGTVFELKHVQFYKPQSLKVLLWFVMLGIATLYFVTRPTKAQIQAAHPKKRISWLRQAWEQLQQAFGLLIWGDGG